MGQYDQPAFMDKILNETKVSKLSYIGHSQGCSQILYALATPSLQPYFKSRLSSVVLFAPATRFKTGEKNW